jgi:hypothetical protein
VTFDQADISEVKTEWAAGGAENEGLEAATKSTPETSLKAARLEAYPKFQLSPTKYPKPPRFLEIQQAFRRIMPTRTVYDRMITPPTQLPGFKSHLGEDDSLIRKSPSPRTRLLKIAAECVVDHVSNFC